MKIGSVCSRSSSQTSLHCTVLSCYPTWRIIWLFQMWSSTWKNLSSYLKHCLVLLTISDPQPCAINLNYPIYSHSSLKSILYTDKLNWSSSIKITISYSRKCLAWVRRDLQKLHIGKGFEHRHNITTYFWSQLIYTLSHYIHRCQNRNNMDAWIHA